VWSLFPPFYNPMPAAWVPSSADPMVPVWEGESEPTQNPAEMDSDGDGLSDWLEQYLGTSPGNPDSDYDGLSDSFELWTSNTSPINWDSDSDGFSDHDAYYGCWNVNHQIMGYGATVYDWDGDGLYNPDDAFPFDPHNVSTPSVDSDGDGIPDHEDAWPYDFYNGNGGGGGGSGSPDSDGDGIPDDQDAWPNDPFNGNPPLPPDSDSDGIPDELDAWPNDPTNGNSPPADPDTDGDGVPNSTDTHPENSSLWNDHNGNGINDHEEPPDPYDPWTADGDSDGRVDASDSHPGDALLWSDCDNDDLNAEEEQVLGTSPYERDTDYDGLTDSEEVNYQTNPLNPDTDADGLTDYEELTGTFGSSALDKFSLSRGRGWGETYTDWQLADLQDTDGDDIPDRIEDIYAPYLNRNNPADGGWDADADGVSNLVAYQNGWAVRAYVTAIDRDGDGIEDVVEDQYPGILDKFKFADAVEDPDGDDLMNWQEVAMLSFHPGNAQSRYPGMADRVSWHWLRLKSDIETYQGSAGTTPWAALTYLNRLPESYSEQLSGWASTADTNANGVPDGLVAFLAEVAPVYLPTPGRVAVNDYDGDGLPDVWEWKFRAVLDPLDATDAGLLQAAGQQLPEVIEPETSDPRFYDSTDQFVLSLYDDAVLVWQAEVAARAHIDADGDGLTNRTEHVLQTHPLIPDSDGDGYADGVEYHQGGNPNNGTVLPPLVLSMMSGDGQVVVAGTPVAEPLILKATRAGLPAVGVAVSAAASGGALSSSFNGPWASSKVVSTNVNGEAAFLWQPPAAAGSWTVKVSAAGTGSKTFHLSTTMPTLIMTATGGQGQAAEVGTVAAQPLSVQIGRGSLSMAGLPVTFTSLGGEISTSVAGPWQSSMAVPANAQGHAEVYWKAPATAGGYGVQASVTTGTGADAATVSQGFALQAFAPGGGTGGTGGTGGNGNTGGPEPGKLEMRIWERTIDFVTGLGETRGIYQQLDEENGYWEVPEWMQRLQLAFASMEEDTGRILFIPDASYYEVRAGAPLATIASETGFSSDDYTVKLAEAEAFYFAAGLVDPIFGYALSSQRPMIQYHDQPSTDRSAHERRIKYVVSEGELESEHTVAYLVRCRSESYAAGSGPPIEKWFTVTFTAPEGANPGVAANVSIKGLLDEAAVCGITTSGNELHLNPPPILNGKNELTLLPMELAPGVLAVNTNFDEGDVDNETHYAKPDCENGTLKAARDHLDGNWEVGDIVTEDLHKGFFGMRPGVLPYGQTNGATVTIRKLSAIDPDTGHEESGHVCLWAVRGPPDNENEMRIDLYNPDNLQPYNLGPLLYDQDPGEPVTYYIEGAKPGKITLEFNYQKGDLNLNVDQQFTVCTRKSKKDWQDEIAYQIRLQSGVDVKTLNPNNPYPAQKPVIEAIYNYYGQMYLQSDDVLQWSGLGKLAGAAVYSGLNQSLIDSSGTSVGLRHALLSGAKAVYEDIAWQHRCYQASKIWGIKWVAENDSTFSYGQPQVSLNNWIDCYNGEKTGNQTFIDIYAREIARREQQFVLRGAFELIATLGTNPPGPGWVARSMSDNAKSPIPPGVPTFLSVFPAEVEGNEVLPTNAYITNFSYRWHWVAEAVTSMLGVWSGKGGLSRKAHVLTDLDELAELHNTY